MAESSETDCPICKAKSVGAFVQHGSYFTHCLACGEYGPATSWQALFEKLPGQIRAVVVDDNYNEIELLGEGNANEIALPISKAAQQGKLVQLKVPHVSGQGHR
jgi:hypothetical protein